MGYWQEAKTFDKHRDIYAVNHVVFASSGWPAGIFTF